jgi:hypothetical protein
MCNSLRLPPVQVDGGLDAIGTLSPSLFPLHTYLAAPTLSMLLPWQGNVGKTLDDSDSEDEGMSVLNKRRHTVASAGEPAVTGGSVQVTRWCCHRAAVVPADGMLFSGWLWFIP